MAIASRLPGRRICRESAWSVPSHFIFEPLEHRQLLSASVVQTIQAQTFPENTSGTVQPVQADMYTFFADTVTGQQDLTFKATSDNTPLVSTAVSGGIVTLGIPPSASGYAHIHVIATDPNGATASQTFRVQLVASTARSLDVTLSGAKKTFQFTQANHASAKISLVGPGTATIHLTGDNLKLDGDHARGTNQQVEKITISGATAATSLRIIGNSRRLSAIIGNITVDGSLETLQLTGAALEGDLNVTGGIHIFNVSTALSGDVALGGAGRPMLVDASFMEDENFTSTSPILHARLGQWVNSDSNAETFSAPYIEHLSSAGSFTPGLQLSGTGAPRYTLNHFAIGGNVGGTWNIAGASGPLRFGGALLDFRATFGSISSIVDNGLFDGTITAPTLDKFTVHGAMVSAGLILTAANATDIRQLIAPAGMFGVTLSAAGSIGDITTMTLAGCNVTAGVGTLAAGETLPTSTSEFASPASIHTIVTHPRGKSVGYTGSNIAASAIGTLSFGTMKTANGGTRFGIAATSIASFSARDRTTPQTVNFKSLHDPSALAAQIAARKLNMGDFVIRLL